MKIFATKVLALGSLCALLMGTGSLANAQGYDRDHGPGPGQFRQGGDHWQQGPDRYHHGPFNHPPIRFGVEHDSIYWHAGQSERRRLDRLHAVYAYDVAHRDYSGAERAHEHAEAIRAQLRAGHWHNR